MHIAGLIDQVYSQPAFIMPSNEKRPGGNCYTPADVEHESVSPGPPAINVRPRHLPKKMTPGEQMYAVSGNQPLLEWEQVKSPSRRTTAIKRPHRHPGDDQGLPVSMIIQRTEHIAHPQRSPL
ncbi:hypothetical protein ACS0TY_007563 [Phlomoides rotata]